MKHSLSEPRLIKTDALAVRRLCVRPRDLGCPCSSTEPRTPLLSTRLQWWSTPMSKNIRGISASWRRRRSQGSLGVGSALRDSLCARTTISDDAPKFRDGWVCVILGISSVTQSDLSSVIQHPGVPHCSLCASGLESSMQILAQDLGSA